MDTTKITISKQDSRSEILGEYVTATIDSKLVDSYISLVKKAWPNTKISTRRVNG